MTGATPADLAAALQPWRCFQECLLEAVSLVHHGYALHLRFNYIWDRDGHVRPDILERPELVLLRLEAVDELRLIGGLNPSMVAHPDRINWGLSEVSGVVATEGGRSPLGVEVRWEGARRLTASFHRFRLSAEHTIA